MKGREHISVFHVTDHYYTYSIPCAVCLAMSISWNMSNLVSSTCRWRYRLLPSHHWVIIAKVGFVIKPMKSRMLTWRVFLRREIRERMLAKTRKSYLHYKNIPDPYKPLPTPLTHLRTCISFLKAWICSDVGLVTLRILTATSPCHLPRNTVPKEPAPMRFSITTSLEFTSQ